MKGRSLGYCSVGGIKKSSLLIDRVASAGLGALSTVNDSADEAANHVKT